MLTAIRPSIPGYASASLPASGFKEGGRQSKSDEKVKLYRFEVLGTYPHDRQAFTQGLTYHDGLLFESTGLQGESSLRKVDLDTGRVLKRIDLEQKYFAEGLTILKGKIYQLTWLTHVGFVYNLTTLDKVGEFHYEGEGWGLTNNGRSLIISDGSNRLKFLDPGDFKVERSIEVFYQGQPLTELNELEYINGEIFSNVWHKDIIARIDPTNGHLLGIIDLTGLGSGLGLGPEDVLNGIAYLPKNGCLLVTGKRWPLLFRIRPIILGASGTHERYEGNQPLTAETLRKQKSCKEVSGLTPSQPCSVAWQAHYLCRRFGQALVGSLAQCISNRAG